MYVPSDVVTKSARESLIQNGIDDDEVDAFLSQKRSFSEIIGFIFQHADELDDDYYGYDGAYITSDYEMPDFDDILNDLR